MTTTQDIITLLTDQLNSAVLLLGSSAATYTVVDYTDPAYLLKMFLLNKKVDVLFTVKSAQSLTGRIHQGVPYTDRGDYEVDVWCASKTPHLNTNYKNLKDAGVAEVKRIFKAFPTYGTEKATRNDPHVKGNVQIYNSTVTVTKNTYT